MNEMGLPVTVNFVAYYLKMRAAAKMGEIKTRRFSKSFHIESEKINVHGETFLRHRNFKCWVRTWYLKMS